MTILATDLILAKVRPTGVRYTALSVLRRVRSVLPGIAAFPMQTTTHSLREGR
jgi:hypothetical protein